MPIYEYECTSCHHHFDLIQKVNAEPVKQCPKCLDNSVVKLVSAAGFQLKGAGWYATDFKTPSTTTGKSDNNTEAAKPKETTAAKESSTQTTKGDSE